MVSEPMRVQRAPSAERYASNKVAGADEPHPAGRSARTARGVDAVFAGVDAALEGVSLGCGREDARMTRGCRQRLAHHHASLAPVVSASDRRDAGNIQRCR